MFNSTADITTDVGTGLYMAPELKNTNSLGMSEWKLLQKNIKKKLKKKTFFKFFYSQNQTTVQVQP